MTFPTPQTPRLRFLAPSQHHIDPLHDLFNDPDVMQHIGTGTVWTKNEIARRIDRGIALVAAGRPYFWTVQRRDTGDIIGQGGLVEIDFNGPETELGYRLGKAHWGNGFATEIARTAVDCAFTAADRGGLALPRLVAVCHPDNTASRRVLASAGFTELRRTDAYYGITSLLHEHNGPPA